MRTTNFTKEDQLFHLAQKVVGKSHESVKPVANSEHVMSTGGEYLVKESPAGVAISPHLILFGSFSNGSTIVPQLSESDLALGYTHLSKINLIEIIFYLIFLFLGGIANLLVLLNICRSDFHRSSRHHFLLLNLTTADSLVSFILIPVEIGWRLTGSWNLTSFGCKLFQFMRVFALYLSSLILICISIDRFYAVNHPFKYNRADSVIRWSVRASWIASAIFSLPQTLIFTLKPHPIVSTFKQCVAFGSFPHRWQERVYNIFSVTIIYFLPLICITVCYTCICLRIRKRTLRKKQNPEVRVEPTTTEFRSLSVSEYTTPGIYSNYKRHRLIQQKIFKETLVIIAAFIVCWTPYVTMTVWYQIDDKSARGVDHTLQNILFLFAVSNSTVNPFIYGKFHRRGAQGTPVDC